MKCNHMTLQQILLNIHRRIPVPLGRKVPEFSDFGSIASTQKLRHKKKVPPHLGGVAPVAVRSTSLSAELGGFLNDGCHHESPRHESWLLNLVSTRNVSNIYCTMYRFYRV